VAELVDAPGLGPGAFGREGSSPFSRTNKLLPEPTPVETGRDTVPDDGQRSPTRVGVVRVSGLVGSSSAVGGVAEAPGWARCCRWCVCGGVQAGAGQLVEGWGE